MKGGRSRGSAARRSPSEKAGVLAEAADRDRLGRRRRSRGNRRGSSKPHLGALRRVRGAGSCFRIRTRGGRDHHARKGVGAIPGPPARVYRRTRNKSQAGGNAAWGHAVHRRFCAAASTRTTCADHRERLGMFNGGTSKNTVPETGVVHPRFALRVGHRGCARARRCRQRRCFGYSVAGAPGVTIDASAARIAPRHWLTHARNRPSCAMCSRSVCTRRRARRR